MNAQPKLANLQKQAAELLAQQILGGAYSEGAALPTEMELCAQLGVSRTTVRGAVRELAAKGLLDVGPSRGTRVRPRCDWNLLDAEMMRWRIRLGVDRKLVEDIYEMRETFEPRASQLAAERGTAAEHAAIRRACAELAAARGAGPSVEADVAFHTTILRSTGNDYIGALSGAASMALRISFEIARVRKEMSSDDLAEHRKIADAILRRSGRRAFDATAALLARSKRVQIRAVALQRPRL